MNGPTAIFLQYTPRFQYIRKSLSDKPKKMKINVFVFFSTKTFNNLVYFLNHDMITKGAMTLSIMTLSITMLIIMTLSITMLSITMLSITTLSIMTLSITTLSIMTLSIMTLSITTFNITINKSRHST
jgi:hypothetical protein